MRAVVMAGGKGTRLRAVTGDAVPKPMALVAGRPILERQVERLVANGVTDVTVVVGHLGEAIERHFGDGSRWGARIDYVREGEPLGTAGALWHLRGRLDAPFLLVLGDVVFDVDVARFAAFHAAHGAAMTLFAHPNAHPQDSDVLLCGEDGRVGRILRKGEPRPESYPNLVNAGLYVVEPEALDLVDAPRMIDLEREVVAPLVVQGRVWAYRSPEYVHDAGTPERLAQAGRDLEAGVVRAKNMSRPQRCVFLDRDGTLNVHVGFLRDPSQMELLPGAAEAVRRLNRSGLLAVVATNQPVLARGECSWDGMRRINQRLEMLLADEGAYIDGLYLCPHHPDSGFPGEVPGLKGECACRKPATGLLEQAAADLNVDLSRSWMVGDSTADVECARRAGMRSVLVATGEGGGDGKHDAEPDLRAADLAEAVAMILEEETDGRSA